ncbi:uncharacterized protein LOC119385126 isoform X4 [Rhipicephalus sanguineus]|uniref:uncharacterized protein LOC119385126 isoform X4 n=1 Tax=Rhipicephalus sanguineus TaxID=34632 RepID=UPI0020C4E01D|nr:uncharacterized protein LOC119385126 isoform X4 [Rhipicephalus sanguineus]
MRTALATVLLYLSSLPGPGSTTSNLFEVHEFLFMNKSILYLWKRRSNPKADRFCLCYGPSAAMSRHFGAFNCSASRRGALCHVRDSFAGCFGNAELAQASPQRRDAFVIPARLPSLPLAESTAGATIQCRLIDNTTADVLGDFPGNTNLTFCGVDVCRHCVGGFSNRTFCTSLWTRDPPPDRPCFSTGVVKSWSEIWLYWWPQDDTSDGYVVSWCGGSDEGSHHAVTAVVAGATVAPAYENCSTDVSGSSIALRHLQAFTKYVFSMRAYRWLDANKTERLFSRPLKSQPIVLINPSFIPVFVFVAIPAVSAIVSIVLILANTVLRRELPSPRLNRAPEQQQPRRNPTYHRPPQLPPIVLRRHSHGDFE